MDQTSLQPAVEPGAPPVQVKLWDGPTRLVHWLLVVLIAFSWWSSKDHLDWHMWSGVTILALVAFRVYWGFAGGGASRFGSFVRGPIATLSYLKTLHTRRASDMPGHNPLGAWSVLAILATLLTQIITGLFSSDVDGLESGPLSPAVDFDTSRLMAETHETVFTVLQLLVGLHIAAVVFYAVWKRSNLLGPMITGTRLLSADPDLPKAPAWRVAVGAALAAAIAWWAWRGAPLPW
jgi:cytochrome b